MSAPKRQRTHPLQGSTAKRRCTDESVLNLLEECAKKQRDHIAKMENVLESHKPRFERLQRHVQYHLGVQQERLRVQSLTKDQIKEYEKRISDYNRQAMIEKMDVEEMEKQEEKLETIVQDVVKYKGYRLRKAEKRVSRLPEPTLYGPYEQKLKDALLNIPSVFRDDAKMETVPKLQRKDLDYIEWPEVIDNWRKYSFHWNNEFEEAVECRNLNEKINKLKGKLVEALTVYEEAQDRRDKIRLYDAYRNCPIHGNKIRDVERTEHTEKLEQLIKMSFEKKVSLKKLKAKQRVLEASKKEREDLLKSIQEDMNAESLKCSVCFESLTNGEQSERCPQLFGSCGHTVCATCMQQFKARHSPYHWTCHQCRAPSDKVLTNWALMQLIKEIPGQPQRVVVDAPQAVPIVPAQWRLEQREPNLVEMVEIQLERFEAPVVPGPVVAPLRAWAPMGDPIAPAPEVPLDREPDQEPNVLQDIDDIMDRHQRRMQEVDRTLERGRLVLERHRRFNEERQADRDQALAERLLDPNFNLAVPPPPPALWQPMQVDQLFPDLGVPPPPPPPLLHADEDDDDDEDALHVAPDAPVAPPPPLPVPPAPQADPMDDGDLEVLEVNIHAPLQVHRPVVQIEGEIEYIVLE